MRLVATGRAWLGSALMRLGFRIAGGPTEKELEELPLPWDDVPPVDIGERGMEMIRGGMVSTRTAVIDEPIKPLAGSLADRRARARAGA